MARTAAVAEKVSPVKFDLNQDVDLAVKSFGDDVRRKYDEALQDIKLHEALASVWNLISWADKYVNERKPWAIKDVEVLRKTVANLGYLVGAVTDLVEPFLPETADKIRKQIWLDDSVINFKKGDNLFPRLV